MTPQWRSFSPKQVENALLRAGFARARKSASSHHYYAKPKPQGGYWVVTVPFHKNPIPLVRSAVSSNRQV